MEEVIVRLKDDLDPEQIAEHVVYFGVAGKWRRIDLTAEHKEALDAFLAPYIEHSRPASDEEATTRSRRKVARITAEELDAARKALDKKIREWAKAQDPPMPVSSPAGFIIPAATRAAYEAAQTERKAS